MYLSDALLTAALVVEIVLVVLQIKHNKHRKSVRGIAVEYVFLHIVAASLSVVTTLAYRTEAVAALYQKRFPIYPDIGVSSPMLLVEFWLPFLDCALVWQLYVVYRQTKNCGQTVTMVFYVIVGHLAALVLYVVYSPGYNLLDFVDSLWFASKVSNMVKLVPQLLLNWFGDHVTGFSRHWFGLQVAGVALTLAGKIAVPWHYEWHDVPVNFPPWIYVALTAAWLVVAQYQAYRYRDNRASLKPLYRRDEPVLNV